MADKQLSPSHIPFPKSILKTFKTLLFLRLGWERLRKNISGAPRAGD